VIELCIDELDSIVTWTSFACGAVRWTTVTLFDLESSPACPQRAVQPGTPPAPFIRDSPAGLAAESPFIHPALPGRVHSERRQSLPAGHVVYEYISLSTATTRATLTVRLPHVRKSCCAHSGVSACLVRCQCLTCDRTSGTNDGHGGSAQGRHIK
jgi:hypothetical protein